MAESKLPSAERRQLIAGLARQREALRVSELAHRFGVSEVTIRSDLALLAEQGLLLRRRGGAVANTNASVTTAYEERAQLYPEAKRRIGLAAAQLVRPGETIIIDAGTTTLEMARNLAGITPLIVITNALNIASQLSCLPDVHVIQLGGSLNRDTISTVGPFVERDLGDIMASKVFLGIHAVDAETGLTDTSIEIAQVKRAMLRSAKQVILLADHSKWQRAAFARIAQLSAVDIMITDTSLPEEARTAVTNLGIELIIA